MGKQLGLSLIILFLLFFLPWLWSEPAPEYPPDPAPQENIPNLNHTDSTPDAVLLSGGSADSAVMLRVLIQGQLQEMDMASYLMGVVRSEMPASFSSEALKAQAVAARTYTYHKMRSGGSTNHPLADACDDISCCKAYMEQTAAAANWGTQAPVWEAKIRQAVADTDGECVLYEDEPVLAVFHSSSAGATLNAADVWSSSLPYLQSVSSPENEDTVPNYHSSATFSSGELQVILQSAFPQADFSSRPSDWFTNMQLQPNGTVTSLTVGGVPVSGNQLRTALGLRSACFSISFTGDTVTFSVTGYGHGVGMSQYGANVLAANGMDYREILAWYYTGTTVGLYTP